MKANSRACIAFIAGSIISGKSSSSIYDYSNSKHINISGDTSTDDVNIYDHDRGCHIFGTLPSLYDYGNSKHLNLEIDGSQFSGYDYDSGKHFSGNVNGSSISIFDHETSQHYQYSL